MKVNRSYSPSLLPRQSVQEGPAKQEARLRRPVRRTITAFPVNGYGMVVAGDWLAVRAYKARQRSAACVKQLNAKRAAGPGPGVHQQLLAGKVRAVGRGRAPGVAAMGAGEGPQP